MPNPASRRCRNVLCTVSIPPSSPCSQPVGCTTLVTPRCVSGTCVHSICGVGGLESAGPMYVHTIPPNSSVGYAVIFTLSLKLDSAGSEGMSTQSPCTSNFHPWYTQRIPASSFRPKKRLARRCGQ